MNRSDYISGKERTKAADPEIKPGQSWKSTTQHDFGNGLVDYSIYINFQDPMTHAWLCSYQYGQNVTIGSASIHSVHLTKEQIHKNFEFVTLVQPQPPYVNPMTFPMQPIPMNPNYIPAPMFPMNDGVPFDNRWIQPNTFVSDRTYPYTNFTATSFMDSVSGATIPGSSAGGGVSGYATTGSTDASMAEGQASHAEGQLSYAGAMPTNRETIDRLMSFAGALAGR